MTRSNNGLVDLQVLSDVGLKGIVGGATLNVGDAGVVARSMDVKGVSLDGEQLKFLARQSLAGVVGIPC